MVALEFAEGAPQLASNVHGEAVVQTRAVVEKVTEQRDAEREHLGFLATHHGAGGVLRSRV